MAELFNYKTLVHACAGCVGSGAAACVTMPLTTAFTRIQLEEARKSEGPLRVILQLVRDEGWTTLFRGGQSTLLSVAVSNFLYFYSFHGLKTLTGAKNQKAVKDLLFACVAGCINVLLTNPLWVVNSRLKMAGIKNDVQKYKGTLDGLIKIAMEEGLGSLWNGTKASLMLVSNPAIKFTVYELLKRHYARVTGRQVKGGLWAFWLGCLATAAATVVTYPVQLIQARARHDARSEGMVRTAQRIVAQAGVAGLFRGLLTKLLQSMVAAGFMFMSYENIFEVVNRLMATSKVAQKIK